MFRTGRDLRFYPSAMGALRVLAPDQIEAFNRDGFIAPLRLFDPTEMDDFRCYFDGVLARHLATGKDNYSINGAHLRYGRAWDLLMDRRIVAVVRDVLGEDIVGWGAHYWCKLPGDGKRVAWHQDATYWPLSPPRAVTVWLAIDCADRDNACMKFIPGSHRLGALTAELTEEDEESVLPLKVPEAEQHGEPVYVELQPGEASLHCDLLLHASDVNLSNRRRCGLALRYTTGEVHATEDWYAKGVVVSGTPRAPWANRARPPQD